jgi:transcriptional regulator with XRE-family HTH domain
MGRKAKNELIAWRKRHKLSQRAAAIKLGCSRGAWLNWENGISRTPRYIRLAMLAIERGLELK